LKKKVPDCLK